MADSNCGAVLKDAVAAAVFSGSSFCFDDVERLAVVVDQVGGVATPVRDDVVPGSAAVESRYQVGDIFICRGSQDVELPSGTYFEVAEAAKFAEFFADLAFFRRVTAFSYRSSSRAKVAFRSPWERLSPSFGSRGGSEVFPD